MIVTSERRIPANLRVRVQLIRHFQTCASDIHLQNECAHVGLSVHAPVHRGVFVVLWLSSATVISRCDASPHEYSEKHERMEKMCYKSRRRG